MAGTVTKGRPSKSNSRDLRSLILERAVQIFSQHGYKGASLRMISGELDVSVSSVAYHIKSKTNLYSLVLSQIAGSLENLAADIEATQPASADIVGNLQVWTRDHPDYARIILHDLMENAGRAERVDHWYLRDAIERMINQTRLAGKNSNDPAMRFVAILGAVTYSEIAMPTILAFIENEDEANVRARLKTVLGKLG